MKVVVFGSETDYAEMVDILRSVPTERNRNIDPVYLNDYDELRRGLAGNEYDLVIVLANGAEGMEACIGTRKICPHIPLFWFSDDSNFGPQSYRIGCTHFSTKPPTELRVKTAFEMLRESTAFGQEITTLQSKTAY